MPVVTRQGSSRVAFAYLDVKWDGTNTLKPVLAPGCPSLNLLFVGAPGESVFHKKQNADEQLDPPVGAFGWKL